MVTIRERFAAGLFVVGITLLSACGGGNGGSAPPTPPLTGTANGDARTGQAVSQSATGPLFPNGYDEPASFVPYAGSSVWSTRVPEDPRLYPDSNAIVNSIFPTNGALRKPPNGATGQPMYYASTANPRNGSNGGLRNQPGGAFDVSHPIYYAATSDPLITVICAQSITQQCGNVPGGVPTQIYIPNKALGAQSIDGDEHFAIVQPPNDPNTSYANHLIEFYVYRGTGPSVLDPRKSGGWGKPGNTTIGGTTGVYVDDCGDFLHGTGMAATTTQNGGELYATTAGNACAGAGLVRPSELVGGAGAIHHALFLTAQCQEPNVNVYPAPPDHSMGACTGGFGPPIGARFWSDVACPAIAANSGLTNPEKAILCALHDYGGYIMDSGSGTGDITGTGIGIAVPGSEGTQAQVSFGTPDQWAQLAAYGWVSANIPGDFSPRWFATNNEDENGDWFPARFSFLNHMHVLDPCVTQRTC